jgi:hypothetical protein
LEIYIINNTSIGQQISSIFKVGQNYHNNYLDNFKDIYRKISQLRNLEKAYGSLIMTSNLNINPDLAIARERIYQDYIHKCQILLVEVPSLAEKLAIYLIQRDQHWFPEHVNIDVSEVYEKCFQDNLTLTKNCILRKSLTYFPMTFRKNSRKYTRK